MPKPKAKYDYEKARKLENYVRKRYRNQMSNGAMQLYFSLPHLEQNGLGLCEPITADYHELGKASFKAVSGLKRPLEEMKGILCEVVIGEPIKNGKEATRIRRYTLKELMYGEPKYRLIDTRPGSAKRLAEIMNTRSFVYGQETIKPSWNILKTGRIQSSQPNIQSHSKEKRVENLLCGLDDNEVLIHVDYKSAEPSAIQAAIDFKWSEDPYDLISRIEGIDKEQAKERVNMLAYAKSATRIVSHWNESSREAFMDYAIALDAYKAKLWQIGKPRNGQRRHVQTLGGSKIIADKGDPPHQGTVLNWHIQGTIADIVNVACLRLIDLEKTEGWKFCFLVHDAVYVIGKKEQAFHVQSIMEEEARRLTLPLVAEVEVHEKP